MSVATQVTLSVWRGAFRDIRTRRSSFFLSGLVVPTVFSVVSALLVRPERGELVRIFTPIPIMLTLGVFAIVALHSTRRSKYLSLSRQRITALLHRMYFVGMLIASSAYLLRIAIDYTTQYTGLPEWVVTGQVAMYVISALLGLAWSPSSIPRSAADEEVAADRGARWVPWAVGLQASLVGLGVFLGAWFMREDVTLGGLMLVGVALLASFLMITVSMLGFYRFLILALTDPPAEYVQKLGVA